MNHDEAKFILRAYRPGGRDAHTALFKEALEQARHDRALGEWFSREQAHDTIIAAKLNEVMPPPGLRDKIIAGGRVSRGAASSRRRTVAWMGLAASFIVALALVETMAVRQREAGQLSYARFVAADAIRGGHDGEAMDSMETMIAMLGRSDVAMPGKLSLNLADLKAGGCRTLDFSDRQAVEVCFTRDGSRYHLYVIPREKGLIPTFNRGTPELVAMADSAVAVWSDQNFDYAVVSRQGMDGLKRLAG